jgi:hypothetical protein
MTEYKRCRVGGIETAVIDTGPVGGSPPSTR